MTAAELTEPDACMDCHPEHFRQWSSSMHAYASDDPVFQAMNRRGQRETGGALGDQCLRCHAPMAVRAGASTDGANLDALPKSQRGVTCAVCHLLGGRHDSPVEITEDTAVQAGLTNPNQTAAHGSMYSALNDRNNPESSKLCESCHQRTYNEWAASVFSTTSQPLSCGNCHMRGRDGLAANVEGVPLRRVHDHRFPGAAVPLVSWPERDELIAATVADLDFSIGAQICVGPGPLGLTLTVTLDNISMGHQWPTGSALSRRAWVEVVATSTAGPVFTSGAFADTEAVADSRDRSLWMFRTTPLDEAGDPVEMPWRASSFDFQLLGPSVTNDRADPRFIHSQARQYQLSADATQIDVRVRVRPIGLDVIRNLVGSGDLSADIAGVSPTFTLGATELQWRAEGGFACVPAQ